MSTGTGDGTDGAGGPQVPFGDGNHVPLDDVLLDVNTQHVVKEIFASCDKDQTGTVAVSVLTDFLTPYFKGNTYKLLKLKRALDPDSANPNVDIDTFCKTMKEWTADLLGTSATKKEDHETSVRATKSEFVSFYCGNSLDLSEITEATCGSSIQNISELGDTSLWQEHVKELEYQNRKLNEELDYMRSHVATLEDQHDSLQKDYSGVSRKLAEVRQLNKQIQQKQQYQDDILESTMTYEKKIDSLKASLQSGEKEIQMLQEQAETSKSENKKLQEKIKALLDKDGQSNSMFRELKSVLNIKETEVSALEETLNQLKVKLDEQQQTIDHYSQTNDLLKTEKRCVERCLRQSLATVADKTSTRPSNSFSTSKPGILKTIRQFSNSIAYHQSAASTTKIPRLLSVANASTDVPNEPTLTRCVGDGGKGLPTQNTSNNGKEQRTDVNPEDISTTLNILCNPLNADDEALWNLQVTKKVFDSGKSLDEEISQLDEAAKREILNVNAKTLLEYENTMDELTKHLNTIKVQKATLTETVQELQSKCKQYDGEIETLKEDSNKKYIKIVDLMRQLDELQNNAEMADQNNAKLSEQLEDERIKFEVEVRKLQETIESLSNEKEKFESVVEEIDAVRCKNEDLEAKLAVFDEVKQVAKKEVENVVSSNRELKEEVEKLQKQLDQSRKENCEQRGKLQVALKDSAWLKSELALNNEKSVQLMIDQDKMGLLVSEALNKIDLLRDEPKGGEKNYVDLLTKLEDLVQNYEQVAKKMTELKSENGQCKALLSKQGEELEMLKSANVELSAVKSESQGRLCDLEKAIEKTKALEAENYELVQKALESKSSLNKLNKEYENLRQQLNGEIEQRGKLSNQLIIFEELNKHDQQEIGALKASLKSAQTSKAVVKDREIINCELKRKELHKSCTASKSETTSKCCEDRNARRLGSFEKMNLKTERLQGKFEAVERNLKQKTEEISRLKMDLIVSRNEKTELAAQNEALNKRFEETVEDVGVLRGMNQDLEQKVLSLRSKIKYFRESREVRIDDSKSEIDKLKKRIDDMTGANVEFEGKLESLKLLLKKRDLKEKRLLKANSNNLLKMGEQAKENLKLKEEIDIVHKKYVTIEKEFKEYSQLSVKEKKFIQKEVDALKSEKCDLEGRLEVTQRELEKSEATIKQELSDVQLNVCGEVEDIMYKMKAVIEFFKEKRLLLSKLTCIAFNAWKQKLQNMPENQSLIQILAANELSQSMVEEFKEPIDVEMAKFKQQLDITSMLLETIASLRYSVRNIASQAVITESAPKELQVTMNEVCTVAPDGAALNRKLCTLTCRNASEESSRVNVEPNLSQKLLEELNSMDNSADMNLEELERKFISVISAFMADVSSFKERQQHLQICRNDVEGLFQQCTERLTTSLKTLGELVATRETDEHNSVSVCLQQVEQIVLMFSRASDLSTQCGALGREQQLLRCMNLVISYAARLKRDSLLATTHGITIKDVEATPRLSRSTSTSDVMKASRKTSCEFTEANEYEEQDDLIELTENVEIQNVEQLIFDDPDFGESGVVISINKGERPKENSVWQFIFRLLKMMLLVIAINVLGNVLFCDHDDSFLMPRFRWCKFWSHLKVTYPDGPPPV